MINFLYVLILYVRQNHISNKENVMSREIVENYFEAFSGKSLEILEKIYHPEIQLEDWVLETQGIESVLIENDKIFCEFKNIWVDVKNIYECKGNIYFCILDIVLDDESIKVVDIIEVKENRIKKISAYRQF